MADNRVANVASGCASSQKYAKAHFLVANGREKIAKIAKFRPIWSGNRPVKHRDYAINSYDWPRHISK